MARNRKYCSAAIRFGPALKAFLLCLVIGGFGVGYVWQKDQIARLGDQIKQREIRLSGVRDLNEKLQKQLATIRSPAKLEERIRTMGLEQPRISDVWRLPEPPREKPSREGQYLVQGANAP